MKNEVLFYPGTALTSYYHDIDNLPASLLKLRLLTACYGEVFDEPLADEGRIIIASWDSASLTSDQQEAIKEFQNVVDNSYPWEYIDE